MSNNDFLSTIFGNARSQNGWLDKSVSDVQLHEIYEQMGSFENAVGNGAHEACGLKLEKSSLPAMRKRTVRIVVKRV